MKLRPPSLSGALAAYTAALAADPRHFKALFTRAFAHDKLRRFDAAIADYTAALALEPSSPFALYNRGISRDRAGLYAAAVADFTAASVGSLVPRSDDGAQADTAQAQRGSMAASSSNWQSVKDKVPFGARRSEGPRQSSTAPQSVNID